MSGTKHDDISQRDIDVLGKWANALKIERTKRKWTLDDASKRMGMSSAYLSQLENGKKTPSLRTMTQVVRTYAMQKLLADMFR